MKRAAGWLAAGFVALWLAAGCFAWLRWTDEQEGAEWRHATQATETAAGEE